MYQNNLENDIKKPVYIGKEAIAVEEKVVNSAIDKAKSIQNKQR